MFHHQTDKLSNRGDCLLRQIDAMIGDTKVPVIEHEGYIFYPASFLGKNILKRGKNGILTPKNKEKYKNFIKKFTIIFYDGVPQETNCIREDVLKELLSKTHLNRISIERRKYQNVLHAYLDIKPLPLVENVVYKFEEKWLSSLDLYTKDIYMYEIENNEDLHFRFCPNCKNYLPLTVRFFSPDDRLEEGLRLICRECRNGEYMHPDEERYKMRKVHNSLYEAMYYDQIDVIHKSCMDGKIRFLPDCYQNKESYLRIIEILYKQGKFTKDEITADLFKKFKLHKFNVLMDIHDVYVHLFGKDYYFYPWRYGSFQYRYVKLTKEVAYKVFWNYIKEFNVHIEDPLKFDYYDIFKKCGIKNFINSLFAEFIVYVNDHEFAGYKLPKVGVNYYKNKDNLLFDLKFLIEKDMKLEIEKIPLYLTRNVLHKKASPLYNYIITNKNGSIYQWVNEIYPNKFVERDFDLNPHRLEFDSDTECFLDELLGEEFKNVYYNSRKNDSVINIEGMLPDWFIFTEKGTVIVEYFGMYVKRQENNSSRIREYIKKTDNKLIKYQNDIVGYEYLFLYPDDIERDFEGTRKKIEDLKKKLYG